jgi:autoinducer 2-degrading protein
VVIAFLDYFLNIDIFYEKMLSITSKRLYSSSARRFADAAKSTYPIALIVNVEIKKDRVADFLKVIEQDAIGSRERENGGCLRFNVHRDQTNESKFIVYEVYKDQAAIEFHKSTPHFKLWTDFKESGGVASVSFSKTDAIFFV